MEARSSDSPHPWRWIPTLYFAQGIPYVAVTTLSVVLYKNLGISNTDIALYTSWLYLPWAIKPLWSPVVDLHRTKRFWIVSLQLAMAVALVGVALLLPRSYFFVGTLAVFWALAFCSATHDIAADGFYLLALKPHQQAAFVGVRSTFYRFAMIAGQGGLVWLAGTWTDLSGNAATGWSWTFALAGGVFLLLTGHHACFLPRLESTRAQPRSTTFAADYARVFVDFFRKERIGTFLAYLLLYRFAESQLLKLVPPFLLDARNVGGLGLSTQDVGILYGTVGVIALTLGGISGGLVVARFGLKRMLWPMLLAMNAPNLVFVALALLQPSDLFLIGSSLAIEQFGYGFGFTAYLVTMMMIAGGEHRTAHYAICTGFMALGMMLPGMGAGWLQEKLGYANFFIWVCIATLPSFLATAALKIDPAYGKKA